MRFALLGLDAHTLALARAIAAGEAHEIVWAVEVDDARDAVREVAPHARIGSGWESLLDGHVADAVLLARGGDEELRADQLRKLVQNAVPLLVSHPIHDSMLLCYELDMIQQDTGGVILPYLPGRWHPALLRWREWFPVAGDGPCGSLEQIVIQRTQQDRSRPAVERQFARDIDLARSMCGELTRLAAMAPGGTEDYSSLGVQLSGPAGVLVRWSVGPVDRQSGATMTLVGSKGQAALWMPDKGAWHLDVQPAEATSYSEDFPDWQPAELAISRFAEVVGRESAEPSPSNPWRHPDWLDAARSIELAESIERSIAKGKTLELHYEDYTEQSTFKGTMASLGCALLCGAMVLLIVLAVVGRVTTAFQYWPHLLAAVLGLFLLLQLLRLVFPSADEKPSDAG